MNKNDKKVLRMIRWCEEYIRRAEANGEKETFPMGDDIGFNVLWCEKRNLEEYKEMLGKDKRTLQGRLKELYLSI